MGPWRDGTLTRMGWTLVLGGVRPWQVGGWDHDGVGLLTGSPSWRAGTLVWWDLDGIDETLVG